MKEKILVVDDNKNLQFILANLLTDEGFKVVSLTNGKKAVEVAKAESPDLMLLDIRLPGISGMDILAELKKLELDFPVLMITAFGDVKSAVKAIKSGAYDYVTKPFDNTDLLNNIRKALEKRALTQEVKDLKEKLKEKAEKVMGDSIQIQKILKKVELIAPTNMSVIIQGKSGTGKEVAANMIHSKSPRSDKPFIAVDCGAIPETLIESEFFGHEKGAFTGANQRKAGVFELANEGTLFLDEITNLSIDYQVKLLRVIQERKVKRIGDTKMTDIDVRILAASNIDVLQCVRDGKFREDLFHRLNEFKITLPNLQDRKDDIPALAQQFMNSANSDLKKSVSGFTTEAVEMLMNYEWPGNVRELKHVIKRAVLMEEEDKIHPENLQLESYVTSGISRQNLIENHLSKIMDSESSLAEITAEFSGEIEKEIIEEILKKMKYNKTKVAKLLGIDRNTLYAKMKNLGIVKL
jgi:DNA-binding NtrC family response regulator